MVKEKTLGPPEVGDLEQAILKAFYEGLMQPQHEHDATGRRRFVFDIEIVIETGRAPLDETSLDPSAAGTPGGLEQALIRTVSEGVTQAARDESTADTMRMVFEIDITVEDGRLLRASVNDVSIGERRPSAERLH